MKRQKINSRGYISISSRENILEKSGGVCSHCGKKVHIGGNYSTEHVIPIDKGGSDDDRNLVPLCKECNKEKDNTVIGKDIASFFKYLSKSHLYRLDEYVNEYYNTLDWLSYDNWVKDDCTVLTKLGVPETKNYVECENMRFIEKVVLKKARYSDLDSLVDFYIKHSSTIGGECKEERLVNARKLISDFFMTGAIYFLLNGSNEIVGSFHIYIAVGIMDNIKNSLMVSGVLCTKKYLVDLDLALNYLLVGLNNRYKGLIFLVSIIIEKDKTNIIGLIESNYHKNIIPTSLDIGNGHIITLLIGKQSKNCKSRNLINDINKFSIFLEGFSKDRKRVVRNFIPSSLLSDYLKDLISR